VDKNNENYFPLNVENRKKVIIFAVPSVKRRFSKHSSLIYWGAKYGSLKRMLIHTQNLFNLKQTRTKSTLQRRV